MLCCRLLERYKGRLHEFELACLNNLDIDDVDEAFVLVPTLRKKFSDDEMDKILKDLLSYRTA